jgi:hypothetical protein
MAMISSGPKMALKRFRNPGRRMQEAVRGLSVEMTAIWMTPWLSRIIAGFMVASSREERS